MKSATIYNSLYGGQSCSLLFQSSLSALAQNAVQNHFWDSISIHVAVATKTETQSQVWCLCTGHSLEDILLLLSRKPPKIPKQCHFEVALLSRIERLRYHTKGPASCHYKWLAEGLVHWDSLQPSASKCFMFSRYIVKSNT